MKHIGEAVGGLEPLSLERAEAVRDGDIVAVDDGGVGDVAAVRGGRLEDRTDAPIVTNRRSRIGCAGEGFTRSLVDDSPEQLATAPAVLQPHARKPGKVLRAQCRH